MKKILFSLLSLSIAFSGFAQTTKPIDGFLGVKFGSSKDQVIAALNARGGVLLDGSTDKFLAFEGLKLGQRTIEEVDVYLFNNKVNTAILMFKPENDPEIFDYYNALVADINGAYGPGKPYKGFKSPFKDGDGNEQAALEGGYAKIFTEWDNGKNLIQVTATSKLNVRLFYQDGVLKAEQTAQEKAKEKSDL